MSFDDDRFYEDLAADDFRDMEYAELTTERDQARRIAVALEQEVADLRERLEFATWGMS